MIDTECHLWGEKLDYSFTHDMPEVIVREHSTAGETGITGRYKGQSLPYGACTLATPETVVVPDRIVWMADFIDKNMDLFRERGATDIVYWILWTGTQGNMELNPEELRKIANLGIPLCIDYIQVTPEEYEEKEVQKGR